MKLSPEPAEIAALYKPSYTFKYVIVGETAVGKSCFLLQFTEQRFICGHEMTIGADYGERFIIVNGQRVGLKLWDTAGSEKFQSVSQHYYRGAVGALIVYDVTSRKSLSDASRWLNDVRRNCCPETVVMLVGNKCDLDSNRQIRWEEGQLFARENGLLFIEVSARTGRNVEKAFRDLTAQIVKRIQPNEPVESRQQNDGALKINNKKYQVNTCC